MSEPDLSQQWRLSRVEVVNWGTFDNFHGVDIARKGHLFTGPSGSGKSSLLDAITATLAPKRVITFNAAAQEGPGRNADRTWVTYVRGAWAKEADALEDRTVASYLRKGATWSGIMVRFEREGDDPVSLYRLFHMRGSSSSASDLKELSFITRTRQGLLEFAPYAEGGIDAKKLKADHKPLVVAPGTKPGPYFNRMRRLLGIRNETALQLLHRTQAAKNFGTLDTLFRKFMLDEPRTFNMAERAVEEFRELRDAHSHVVDLGYQRDALMLVQQASMEYEGAQESANHLGHLSSSVLPFADALKLDRAKTALSSANGDVTRAHNTLAQVEEQLVSASERVNTANRRVLELGGGDQINLQARIQDAQRDQKRVEERRRSLFKRMSDAGLPIPEEESDYIELVATAERTLDSPPPEGVDHELHERRSQARANVRSFSAELKALNLHKSNIGSKLLEVRDHLADQLGIPAGLMPFAGELISVRPDFEDWTGAIERVLAPMSTALLVRDSDLAAVREAVDNTYLGVNLTIDAVPGHSAPPVPIKDERSLFYRVDVREGQFHEYLNHRLSTEFDFACVDDPGQLDEVDRGVTIRGLIKRSKRRYVKADQNRIDNKSKWVLGGDVEPKRRVLEAKLAQANEEFERADAEMNAAAEERDKVMALRHMLRELLEKPWSEIDTKAPAERIAELQRQFADMVRPDSELGQATGALEQAQNELTRLRDKENAVREKLVLARKERDDLERMISELEAKSHADLPAETSAALEERFRKQRRVIRYNDVHEVAAVVQDQLRTQLTKAQDQVQKASGRFSQFATAFSKEWTTVAINADLTVEIEDRRGYLDLLEDILTRGLPEHEQNFRRLLNERSRESIAFLRDELMGAPSKIAQRIEPVNASLATSPYDKDVYLHINTKTRRTEEVNSFLAELKEIVDGSWADEEFEEAERRFQKLAAIMDRLESKSTRADQDWRKRVLDTREHVTFIAKELDPEGNVINIHDSSAGLSGGQRQKLVVFCLAAALRYQLADQDSEYPQYGTVILDEAFDKADSNYTRVAMDVFNAFGFHMVLATPEKLLQTLEPYLGGISVITNPDRRSSHLASIEY